MLKKMLSAALLLSPVAYGAENPGPEADHIELCAADACSIPMKAKGFENAVYIVKSLEDYETLSHLWTNAIFFVASESDYLELRGGRETLTLPAESERSKAGQSSGPLVSGSITVNVGATGSCASCHTGSWKEIHSGVLMPKKVDNGQ